MNRKENERENNENEIARASRYVNVCVCVCAACVWKIRMKQLVYTFHQKVNYIDDVQMQKHSANKYQKLQPKKVRNCVCRIPISAERITKLSAVAGGDNGAVAATADDDL